MKQSHRITIASWALFAISWLPLLGIGDRHFGWVALGLACLVACTSEIVRAIENFADELFEDEDATPSNGRGEAE